MSGRIAILIDGEGKILAKTKWRPERASGVEELLAVARRRNPHLRAEGLRRIEMDWDDYRDLGVGDAAAVEVDRRGRVRSVVPREDKKTPDPYPPGM